MLRGLKIPVLLLVAAVCCLPAVKGASARELRAPSDPLRSSLGLSLGTLLLENESYRDFFAVEQLTVWTARYDYRVLSFLRVGAALSASSKSRRDTEISLGSEAYPVRYSFTAFNGSAELYLRSNLPKLFGLYPHVSIGALANRIHAEGWGYDDGFDAVWEEYLPATDVVQISTGWRAAAGLQLPIWANVNLLVEGSRIELDTYAEPVDQDPPVGLWDHSGWRLEAGFLQRF